MKKILLQKGRDEVGASLRATPQPSKDPVPPPLIENKPPCSPGEPQKRTPPSFDRLPNSPHDNMAPNPSGDRHQSEFHALLPAVTSLPVSSLPLLMLPIPSRSDYFGDRAGYALQGRPYPGFYQVSEGRFQGPPRLLQYGKPPNEEEFLRRAPYDDDSIARMRKSMEPQHGDYGFAGLVSMETMRREVAMEAMRREVAMDLVSSSNIVEGRKRDSSVDVVDVDSEDEDQRMGSRDDDRRMGSKEEIEDELPRMIERARQMTSPSDRTDTHDDSKTTSPRSDVHESFKSPSASGTQKTVYRTKGRPAKAASAAGASVAGEGGGPGTRSIIRCPVCGKQFNNSSALAKHKLTHSDERKYACTLCNKAFKRQDHLNGHMMTHSSMKPFACKFIGCNKSYCDARSLRRHMENHHQECTGGAGPTAPAGPGQSPGGFFSFDGSPFQPGYGGTEGGSGTGDGSLSYLQQVSPISPVVARIKGTGQTRQFGGGGGGGGQGQMWVTGYNPLDEPKPVKCHVCGRGFKNIPALNGHMRLHGGYIRKDQENVDESQDASRSSDTRTESRFSQSENSQSSASVGDRQHKSSLPGPPTSFAPCPQACGSETGRGLFFLSSGIAEADLGRGGQDKPPIVDREEVRGQEVRGCAEEFRGHAPYVRFGLPERCGARTGGGSREMGEFRAGGSVPLEVRGEFDTRRFGDSERCSDMKLPRREDELPRNFSVKSRHSEQERSALVQIMRLAGHPVTSGVDKLFEFSGSSVSFERDKVKNEVESLGSCSVGASQGPPGEKYPRKVRAVEEAATPLVVSSNPARPSSAVDVCSARVVVEEFERVARGPPRHSKSDSGNRMEYAEVSERKKEKTREEKMSDSWNECFPDSTSGKDVGNANKRTRVASPEESQEDRQTEPNIPSGDIRRPGPDSAQEDCHGATGPPHTSLSPSQQQSACFYRQRWRNLQLKQSGQRSPEIPGDRPLQGSNYGASTYGTGTDCGDPSTPKITHKTAKETANPHPLSDQGRHFFRNVATHGSCPSGIGYLPSRSSPTSPGMSASPPGWKRGGPPAFSYPGQIDAGTSTVTYGCHSATTPREGLHHDPTPYVQSHIPCSPYDPRPHTPCAAHTPFTPCQPYTPHTPYTPCATANQPKHASHFEFPPRVGLQESSMCDSPYTMSGQQAQVSTQQMEIRLVVGSEERTYRPTEKFGKDLELMRLQGYGDCHDLVGTTTDLEQDRSRKHLPTESDGRLNLLWQRDFDRQRQQLHTGTGHPGLQDEARNPEDGFSASLPTGANSNSSGIARNSPAENEERAERKRKPSEDSPIPIETKRCMTEGGNSMGRDNRGAEIPTSSFGVQFKIEEHAKMEGRAEGEWPKGSRVVCSELLPGETLFRNPPSPGKAKKSRPRPEPLFIPANVNHFGFQSRLRSPRLWDGLAKKYTAPPYTPPPMLSPARSGSGLFWKLHSGFLSPLTGPPVLPKYDKVKCISSWPEVTPPPTADERQPPETDLQPHINIGPQYQPDLPQFRGSKPRGEDCANYDDHSTLVWTPNAAAKIKEEEVMQYMQYACCAIIPGNGANLEYAMHLLHLCKGDVKRAVKLLLEPEPKLPRSSGLKTYKYQDCVKWKRVEIDLFHRAIMKLDKDFFQISKMVGSKSVKDCVQFYYLWKKICPDELKQLKVLRRKREQYELYSRRSKDLCGRPPKQPASVHAQKSSQEKSNNVSRSSRKHERMEQFDFRFQDSTGKPVALKEEQMEDSDAEKQWCAICKRSFTSARNFSVHLRMHEKSRTRRGDVERDVAKLPYAKLGSGF